MDEQKTKTLNSLQWLKAAEAVINIERQRYQYTSLDQDIGEKNVDQLQQTASLSDLQSLKVNVSQSPLVQKGSAMIKPESLRDKATVYTLPSHKREE